jgi:hypothetical protein
VARRQHLLLPREARRAPDPAPLLRRRTGARSPRLGTPAVTFTAGLVHYPWVTRFLPWSLVAAVAWALYAGLVGYLGGRVFEEEPLYGLLLAFAIAGTVALAYEVVRRLRRSE